MTQTFQTAPDLLNRMFAAGLAAADPAKVLPPALPPRPGGRVVVVGAGKASARMAQALESAWGPCEGLVAVPHGAGLPTQQIDLLETSHPVPDVASETAARRMLALAQSLTPQDTMVALISGGGSALLAGPADGITLADKQVVTRALLASGAPIDEMNLVRRQLSSVKGGRLAAATRARVLTFVISDVPGDDPALVASGPTIAAPGDHRAAREVIRRYGIGLPQAVARLLDGPDPVMAAQKGEVHLIASAQMALEAAARVAQAAGVTPMILGDSIEGEAREAGRVIAAIAKQVARHGQPGQAPLALISGGETTVTLRGTGGRGGRCSEFLLSFALAAQGFPGISALACDTDGRDGSEHNAGAIWSGAAPFDRLVARRALDDHDAWGFFHATGGLIETGPTHTNVNDLRIALILPPGH